MNLQPVQEHLARVAWSGGGHVLTFGTLFLALALIVGGGLVSRLLAGFFGQRLPGHLRQSRHVREFAPRWIFFGVWALFILFALRVLA